MKIGNLPYYFKSKLLIEGLKLIEERSVVITKKGEIVGPMDFDNETLHGLSKTSL